MVKNYDQKPTSSAAATHSDERISVVKLSKSGGCVDRDADFMKAVRESQIRSYFFGSAVPSTGSASLSLSASSSSTKITLSPHTQQLDFDSLSLYNYTVATIDEDEDDYDPSQFGSGDSFLPGGANAADYSTTTTTNHHHEPSHTTSSSSSSFLPGLEPQSATNDNFRINTANNNHNSNLDTPLKKVPSPPPSILANTLLAITHVPPNATPAETRDASIMGFVYVADVDAEKGKIRVLAPVGGRMPSRALVWGKKWPGEVVGLVG
jgi:polyribonucleotide 5'-hydroxyl-kinase